jgi:hypothetical protein
LQKLEADGRLTDDSKSPYCSTLHPIDRDFIKKSGLITEEGLETASRMIGLNYSDCISIPLVFPHPYVDDRHTLIMSDGQLQASPAQPASPAKKD